MSYYQGVYCSECGNEVCQSCGCCRTPSCPRCNCPDVDREENDED
jgi:hypothetical protein